MLNRTFTEKDVIKSLEGNPKTLRQIVSSIGCSESTAWSIVKALLKDNAIGRINLRSEKKPFWLYYLVVNELSSSYPKILESILTIKGENIVDKKRTLANMGVHL